MRLSDADRSRAAAQLRDACVDGRLTIEEFSGRLETTYAARTIGELAPALHDIEQARIESPSLAPWWSRAAALLVDGCVLTGGTLVLGLPAAIASWSDWPLASTLLFGPLSLAYFTIGHGSKGGQTVGDYVNDIAVKSDEVGVGVGGRASYGQAFGRTVMVGIFLGLFFAGGFLDVLWPLWDRRRQAWHDKVAGTVVVRVPSRFRSAARSHH